MLFQVQYNINWIEQTPNMSVNRLGLKVKGDYRPTGGASVRLEIVGSGPPLGPLVGRGESGLPLGRGRGPSPRCAKYRTSPKMSFKRSAMGWSPFLLSLQVQTCLQVQFSPLVTCPSSPCSWSPVSCSRWATAAELTESNSWTETVYDDYES